MMDIKEHWRVSKTVSMGTLLAITIQTAAIAGMVYIHRQREDAATDAVREIREMSSRKPRSAPRPALCAILMISLTACSTERAAVFDASVVPAPPEYSALYEHALGQQIAACPDRRLILETLRDASGYYGRVRRMKGG